MRDRVVNRVEPTAEEEELARHAREEEAATDRLLRGIRRSPIPRMSGGRFQAGVTAPLPPPTAGPPPPPSHHYPWYTVQLGSDLWDSTLMLPKLMEAVPSPGSKAWPHPPGGGAPSAAIDGLLAWAGKLLLSKARGAPDMHGGYIRLTGKAALEKAVWPVCMQLDPQKIKMTNRAERRGRLVHRNPAPYYKVRLTEPPVNGQAVFEYLHRIILWAMCGPPDLDVLVDPVAMHSCHNGQCVNWRHLSWGERKANLQDRRP